LHEMAKPKPERQRREQNGNKASSLKQHVDGSGCYSPNYLPPSWPGLSRPSTSL
jgi:hypothetical protein